VTGDADLPNGTFKAFLWRPGRGMRSLGTLDGANSGTSDINDATQVVGVSEVQLGSDVFHAFLWTEPHGMEDLGTLARLVTAKHPDTRVLLVSGYDPEHKELPGPFLRKPFSPQELVQAVEQLVALHPSTDHSRGIPA
jgi:probable HAF family extracellular repeat protein